MDKTVVLLLALGNALQDAGIAAWSAKAKWASSRPITALQCMYQGQQVTAWKGPYLGVGARAGSTWQPYQAITFVTPPFPGYISGHSTFSAAAARVLTRYVAVLQPSCPHIDLATVARPHTSTVARR